MDFYGNIEVKIDKKKNKRGKEEYAIFLRTPSGDWAYASGELVLTLPVMLAKLEDSKYVGTSALGGDYHEKKLNHFLQLRKFYSVEDIQNIIWNDFRNMMNKPQNSTPVEVHSE